MWALSDVFLLLLTASLSHLIVTITMEREQDRDRISPVQIEKISLRRVVSYKWLLAEKEPV